MPLALGLVLETEEIPETGLGLAIMGSAYFMTGIIPALFIREKMYDPQQSGTAVVVKETRQEKRDQNSTRADEQGTHIEILSDRKLP